MHTNSQIEFYQQMQKVWAAAFFLIWSPQRPKRIAQVYHVPAVHPSILITSGLISQFHPIWIKPEVSTAIIFFCKFPTKEKSNSKKSTKISIYRITETQQLYVILQQNAAQTVPAASYCKNIQEQLVKAGRGKSELPEPECNHI